MFEQSLTDWQAHYKRYLRSLDQLVSDHVGSNDYMDDLHHFMQDCWHLKDWIKAGRTSEFRKLVEEAVARHKSLLIVADLANAAKHFILTGKERTGARIVSQSATVHLGQRRTTTSCTVRLHDGSLVDVDQLVSNAATAWESVLEELGLKAERG